MSCLVFFDTSLSCKVVKRGFYAYFGKSPIKKPAGTLGTSQLVLLTVTVSLKVSREFLKLLEI